MTGPTREQQRALDAYARVRKVEGPALRADYKPRVNGLGAAVLRDGLAAALAFLEREVGSNTAAERLLEDLTWCLERARLPGLSARDLKEKKNLPGAVRALELDAYMLATRESLRLLVWFRRAVQATFPSEEHGHA
ncbi:type III-B CRISPR module-associated protein Cmr5 [Myxococcus xanthus]|uniref:CRISPR type III-B/RAMP module-associated protein Cmr5 n=1 Tax=Myxococcus xanthus TaxID=34 RepID=A0AAE6KW00_MYXXA|nr:type III-B CRISPR module-associated protein Cmr5 [Myxococcus xanthus]QDE72039.1 type III-B CRISPR module-associated protein Cmr5 [Myxococcus xanthus]QDE79322.1 type III-B CRISPR module-associated protein Cmr5 [Myxococcus xanthus]